MTVLPRGRGGSVNNGGRLGRFAADSRGGDGAGDGRRMLVEAKCRRECRFPWEARGLGENGLGANGSSSLNQFQNGTLGANGQGPLGDIHFDYNDYSVRAQDGQILKSNADWLSQHSAAHVQIEGHCDDRGSEEYNIALGAKRAQAAKDYLETLGVGADRMSTISYGKELPVCTEETDECWAQNRRDHFVVQQ